MTRVLVALIGCLAALPAPVRAEHEVFYRYVVLGYVSDGGGRPLAGERVEVIRDKTGLAYRAETDERGLYVLVLRLGDESAGEALTLRVGDRTARLLARFDPANHTDERGTRVDVEGARVIERSAAFGATLTNFIGAPRR